MTSPPCLAIDGVTHAYGGRVVLRDITLEAGPAEVLCLLGRSGCGKTTLLRLVAGLERPREGVITVNGRVLTGGGVLVPPERRGVGLMFQDYALFPHLTALENVKFGIKAGGGGPDPMDLLARVGLADAARRYPHTFSAGEQQRIALVRALASAPAILLMDEPFSNLDAGTRDQVRGMTLALLAETGTPAVIVTHDPVEAMLIADRIVLMKDGGIEQAGTPEDIYRHPASLYAAGYFSDLNIVEDAAGRPAYIRPHDLRIGAESRIAARITDVAYIGESTLLTLARPAPAAPLKASLRGALNLAVGQDVALAYADRDLLFFT